MTTPQDTDIREALRRKYADKPQLPSDFMQRMHDKMDKEKRTSRRHHLYLIWISAVAAGILLLVFFHIKQDSTYQQQIEAKQSSPVPSDNSYKKSDAPILTEVMEKQTPSAISRPASIKSKVTKKKQVSLEPIKVPKATTTATDSLDIYIARLEAEMEGVDDSVRAAKVEKLIKADYHLQMLVNSIVNEQTEQALNEQKKDSTANYINF